jgi:lipase
VSYVEQGIGEPLVMLHAGGSSGRQWLRSAAILQSEFRVVAPDLWGFGQTDAWKGEESLSHDHQAELVAEVIGQLEMGPSHIVGHSYGGATAVRLALRTQGLVRTLTLIEPVLVTLLKQAGEEELFKEWADMAHAFLHHAKSRDWQSAWQGFIDYRNGAGAWAKLPTDTKERLVANTDNTVAGFHSNLNNPTSLDELRQIKVPTLVLCGENTTLPDRRVAEIVRDQIPRSTYKVIPGADHMSPLSHPSFIAEATRQHAGVS